jgi:hypothetical protein
MATTIFLSADVPQMRIQFDIMELKYAMLSNITESVVMGGAIFYIMKHFQLNLRIIYSIRFSRNLVVLLLWLFCYYNQTSNQPTNQSTK